jgi:putative YhbY family RNA-binding protein
MNLSPAERKALKARAHRLEPVVWIGADGLSDAVVAEVERALAAHELIKVRAAALAREAREMAMAQICERCAAQPVQHIGKVLVLYRRKPEAEKPRERPAVRERKSQTKASRRAVRAGSARPRRKERGKA